MLSFWAMSASYVYGSLITASGKLRVFNWIFVAGIVINWSLNMLLIPGLSAKGAAIATLITQFFVFAGQIALANNLFKLTYPWSYIFKCIVILGTYFALSYGISTQLTMNWMIEIAIITVFCLGISFLTGFFRLSLSQSEE
jgi:O-antigen/teichoic acid export membrane protein